MNTQILIQHLARAWRRHWPLQLASVTVMAVVLLIMNLIFLSFTTFNQLVSHWGKGMEMIVYMKEDTPPDGVDQFKQRLTQSGEFDEINFVSKGDATKKFLTALGGESLELMSDPKWTSPIPASFELRLSDRIPIEGRVVALQSWASQFRAFDVVEDVFYGQGWVENFSRFLRGARGVVGLIWILALSVGLLIVGNCIRLSFLQRRDEIEVLELVGATARFIRMPFLVEGLFIGMLASVTSLILSALLHTLLLQWLGDSWSFWLALKEISPLQPWYVGANLLTGIAFGVFGAWNCVRKLNTGWAALG